MGSGLVYGLCGFAVGIGLALQVLRFVPDEIQKSYDLGYRDGKSSVRLVQPTSQPTKRMSEGKLIEKVESEK